MKFHSHTPILRVKDFAASMDHYVNHLGFQKAWDWGEPPTCGCHLIEHPDKLLHHKTRRARLSDRSTKHFFNRQVIL